MSTSRRRGNNEGSNPVQRKDGRWQIAIRYREGDLPKRLTVTGKTAAEAREKAKTVRERLDASLPAKDRKVTVSRFAEEWMDSTLKASDRKATTKAMYSTLAKKHIVASKIGPISLDKLRPSHIEAWIVELRERELSQSTVRSAYTILRSILDAAVRDEAITKNPAVAIKRPKVDRKEAAYLTRPQIDEVMLAAESTRYAELFILLAHTGLRRGEALALKWTDVDFEKDEIHVRGTLARIDGALTVSDPKTGKSRRKFHISEHARGALKAVEVRQKRERLKAGSVWTQTGFVFTTQTGQPCDPRSALRAFQKAAERAGLSGVGLHTLRHSGATILIESGVPLKVVSELWGHSSIAITGDVYAHVTPKAGVDAMDVLGRALG